MKELKTIIEPNELNATIVQSKLIPIFDVQTLNVKIKKIIEKPEEIVILMGNTGGDYYQELWLYNILTNTFSLINSTLFPLYNKRWWIAQYSKGKMMVGIDALNPPNNTSGKLFYYNGETWSEQKPLGDTYQKWWRSSCDEDDFVVATAYNAGLIHHFNTQTETWTDIRPVVSNPTFSFVKISKGKIFLGVDGGRLYLYDMSTGITTEQRPAGDTNQRWFSGNNSNGKLISAVYAGRVYYYNGSTWSEVQPKGNTNGNWWSSSNFEDKLIVCEYNGRVYYFNGETWSEQRPAGDKNSNWQYVNIYEDKLVVSDYRMYCFNGSTWSELQPDGDITKFWGLGTSINLK